MPGRGGRAPAGAVLLLALCVSCKCRETNCDQAEGGACELRYSPGNVRMSLWTPTLHAAGRCPLLPTRRPQRGGVSAAHRGRNTKHLYTGEGVVTRAGGCVQEGADGEDGSLTGSFLQAESGLLPAGRMWVGASHSALGQQLPPHSPECKHSHIPSGVLISQTWRRWLRRPGRILRGYSPEGPCWWFSAQT